MKKIKEKLKILDEIIKLEDQVLLQLNNLRSQQTLQCGNCEVHEQIKDISIIQTHWYTPPRGCTEGDYWNIGELNFVCDTCKIRNRLLFKKSKKEYEEYVKRNELGDWSGFSNKKKEQKFRNLYLKLFKKIIDTHKESPINFVNKDMLDFEVL